MSLIQPSTSSKLNKGIPTMKSKRVNPSAASKENTPRHRGLDLVIGSEAFNTKHLDAQISSLEALFYSGDFFHFIDAHTRDHLRRARLILSALLLHDYNVSPEVMATVIACVKKRSDLPEVELAQLTTDLANYIEIVHARKSLGLVSVAEDISLDSKLSPLGDFNLVKQLHRSRTFIDDFDLYEKSTKKLNDKFAKALKARRLPETSPAQLHFEQLVAEYKLKHLATKSIPVRPEYLQHLLPKL